MAALVSTAGIRCVKEQASPPCLKSLPTLYPMCPGRKTRGPAYTASHLSLVSCTCRSQAVLKLVEFWWRTGTLLVCSYGAFGHPLSVHSIKLPAPTASAGNLYSPVNPVIPSPGALYWRLSRFDPALDVKSLRSRTWSSLVPYPQGSPGRMPSSRLLHMKG